MSAEAEIRTRVAKLADEDNPTEAIAALVSYGERALASGLEAFQSPTTRYMADNAGSVLIGIGQPAVAPLIELLRQNKSAFNATWTLGYLRDRSAVEPLIAACTNKDQFVRWAAVHGLKELGDRRTIKPLWAIADNPKVSQGTRQEAIAAIAVIEGRLNELQA